MSKRNMWLLGVVFGWLTVSKLVYPHGFWLMVVGAVLYFLPERKWKAITRWWEK